MNLLLGDDQTAIVDAIRGFLAETAPVSRFRPPAPQVGNADGELWPLLGEMGFLGLALPAEAAGPRNPYSSFNLSGINYGSQQWERAQRQGKVVWPYYNVPSRSY